MKSYPTGGPQFDPEWLSADLDGELSPEESSKLKDALANSDALREEQRALELVDSEFRAFFEINRATRSRLDQITAQAVASKPLRVLSKSRLYSLAAAGILLGVFAYFWFTRGAQSPGNFPSLEPTHRTAELLILEDDQIFSFEVSAFTRGAIIGPAVVISDEDVPLCDRSILEIQRGTILVEHRRKDLPLRLHIPDGIIDLTYGSLRLAVAKIGSEVELYDGEAFWVKGHERVSLSAGTRSALPMIPRTDRTSVTSVNPPSSTTKRTQLRGRVVDRTGTPIQNALIDFQAWQEPINFIRLRMITGSDGRFALAIPEGTHRFIDVLATSRTTARRFSIDFDGISSRAIDKDFVVGEGGTVQGHAVDVQGNPVPFAKVVVHSRAEDHPGGIPVAKETARITEADADGFYRLACVGPRFRVHAEDSSMTALEQHTGWIIDGQTIDGLDLVLAPSARIAGIVRDLRDQPVDGASVILTHRTLSQRFSSSTKIVPPSVPPQVTDQDGTFHFDQIPGGVDWEVLADKKGYLPSEPRALDLTLSRDQTLSFVLDDGMTLRGVVLDPFGAPVSQALVHLLVERDGQVQRRVLPARTEADGTFAFDSIRKSRVWVVAQCGQNFAAGLASMMLSEDSSPTLEVKLPEAHTMRGQVIDDSGHPISDCLVEAFPIISTLQGIESESLAKLLPGLLQRRGETDEQGWVEIVGLRPESHVVTVTPYSIPLSATHDSLQHRFDASPHQPWTARIERSLRTLPMTLDVISSKGDPIESFRAAYRYRNGDIDVSSEVALGGSLRPERTLDVFVGGTSELSIQAFDHGTAHLGPFSWHQGSPKNIRVQLKAAITIEGRVSDSAGNPIDGATLSFLDRQKNPIALGVGPERRPCTGFKTGRDGRFRLFDIPEAGLIIVTEFGQTRRESEVISIQASQDSLEIFIE